jgi:hypothetical protein
VRNYTYPYDEHQLTVERWQYDSNDINAEARTFNTGRSQEGLTAGSDSERRKTQMRNLDRWMLLRKSQFSIDSRLSARYTEEL